MTEQIAAVRKYLEGVQAGNKMRGADYNELRHATLGNVLNQCSGTHNFDMDSQEFESDGF